MKNKFIISKYVMLQYLAFLLNPLLSLIVSFFYLIKKSSKVSIIILSMSIALIFIYLPLMYDTSSNFYMNASALYNLESVFNLRLYNMIPLYLKESFDIQFMTVIFFYSSFILYIWFSILLHYKQYAKSNQVIYFLIAFTFLSLIYRDIMDLNRFYLATSLFLLFLYLYEVKKKKYSLIYIILFSILGMQIHTAFLLFIVLFIVSNNISNLFFYKVYPFVMIILSLFSVKIFLLLFNLPILNIQPELFNMIEGYFSANNKWGAAYIDAGHILLRIIEVILILIIYYIGILRLKDNKKDTVVKFTLLLAGLVLFLLKFNALYERYSLAFFLFSILLIYSNIIKKKKVSLRYISIIVLMLIRFLFINFFIYGIIFTSDYSKILKNEEKKNEMMVKPLYYPTILLLNVKEHGYSDTYISKESTRGLEYFDSWRKNPALK